MLKFKSTIFSDENDLFVALHSNKARITETTLRLMAHRRGILYPKSLSRDELIDLVSDLPFSYSHIQDLTDRLSPRINKDYYSFKKIVGKFELSLLSDVMKTVKKERPRTVGSEIIKFNKTLDYFTVDVDYTEFDFSRGKFQQKRRNGGYILFSDSGNGEVVIQFTHTKRIAQILKHIIRAYRHAHRTSLDVQEIDLSTVNEAKDRNSFIESIYESDPNFTFLSLDKVRLSKIKSYFDVADESTEEVAENFVTDEKEEEIDTKDSFVYKLDGASFNGQSLNDSDDIESYCSKGFYKSTVKWRCKAYFLKGNPILDLEFSFDDKHLGKDMKFRIHGKRALKGEERQEIERADFDLVVQKLRQKFFDSYKKLMVDQTPEIELEKEA